MGLKEKRLFLLDIDGTICLGNRLFDGTLDLLTHVKQTGCKYLFLTNNSSKGSLEYVEKLRRMGINAAPEDFLTSLQATAWYLRREYGDEKIYAFGTEAFRRELLDEGLNITDAAEDDVACLVVGFDTELTSRKLEDACVLLQRENMGYVATNPDLVCPTEYGYVPDCGSIIAMLKNVSDQSPVVIGKPKPAMAEMAIERAGISKDKAMIIGDRLYTDIACAMAVEIDSALVLSGETSFDQIAGSPYKPDYIFENIAEFLKAVKKAS